VAGLRLYDFVDDAILERLIRGHEKVAVRVHFDLLNRLTSVVRHETVEEFFSVQNFLRLDLDVRRLALGSAEGLVDHDPGVGQRAPLPLQGS